MSVLTPISVGIRFRVSPRSKMIFLAIAHCYYGIVRNIGMPIPEEYEDITRHIEPMDISVKGKNLDVGDALLDREVPTIPVDQESQLPSASSTAAECNFAFSA